MQISHNKKSQPIQLVQLTDTHLGDQPGERLLSLDTDASLAHVLALVKQQPSVDLLLATGDISNSGSVGSYQRFRALSRGLARHALWLPGNHDLPSAMQMALEGGEELNRSVEIGNWQIIMLNSMTPGETGGALGDEELTFLRQQLQLSAENHELAHVLVCLHHQPVDIGCEWLDQQKVADADALFSVLDEFEHVRAVLWGHVHQAFDQQRKGVRLLATPSTCVQFAPNSADFKLDRQNPGYRRLALSDDGSIETEVHRVEGVTFDLDYERSSGY